MLRIARLAVITAAIIASAAQHGARGADKLLRGNEEGFWDDHAVVVALVTAAHVVGGQDSYLMSVEAVVATETVIPTKLKLSVKVDSSFGPVEVAAPGDRLLICIEVGRDGKWYVPATASFAFLPDQRAEIVQGMNDAIVSEASARIRDAMAGRPYAAFQSPKHPTTQPAAATRP